MEPLIQQIILIRCLNEEESLGTPFFKKNPDPKNMHESYQMYLFNDKLTFTQTFKTYTQTNRIQIYMIIK